MLGAEDPAAAELVRPLAVAGRKNPEGRRDIFATCVVVIVLLAAMEIQPLRADYIMPSPVTVWNAARGCFSDPYHVAVTLRPAVSVVIR
jgi:NitT/TauT family transport system permease protein